MKLATCWVPPWNPLVAWQRPLLLCTTYCFLMSSAVARAELTQLPNGIRVASQRFPFSDTITAGVWIDSGSRFDKKSTNGAAHFLEHMAFKVPGKHS